MALALLWSVSLAQGEGVKEHEQPLSPTACKASAHSRPPSLTPLRLASGAGQTCDKVPAHSPLKIAIASKKVAGAICYDVTNNATCDSSAACCTNPRRVAIVTINHGKLRAQKLFKQLQTAAAAHMLSLWFSLSLAAAIHWGVLLS